MRFHVEFELNEELTQVDIKDNRHHFGEMFEMFQANPKVKDFSIYGDARGGYLILDLDSGEELTELLGPEILDNCSVRAHPLVNLERLRNAFQLWHEQGR
jgi:hypothetical protein